jgi:hypothetical protein
VGPIHYLFTKKFIPSQPVTRALQNIEIPEEERAGEDIASKRGVRNQYTKPSKRPLYSLQVDCLIVISRALHLYKGGTSLTSHLFTLSSTAHRPIGFNLRPYSWLEIVRYIKPRLQNWIKAGGYHSYLSQREKGWTGTEEVAYPFYIDLWEVIDKEEVRILDWRFVKKEEETPLDWYFKPIKDVCQQETNKKSGQKRKHLIHQYQTMRMRNLNLNQKHTQNQKEEELHNKEQEVKHFKGEGQETETRRFQLHASACKSRWR